MQGTRRQSLTDLEQKRSSNVIVVYNDRGRRSFSKLCFVDLHACDDLEAAKLDEEMTQNLEDLTSGREPIANCGSSMLSQLVSDSLTQQTKVLFVRHVRPTDAEASAASLSLARKVMGPKERSSTEVSV
eukprot:Clim_evm2s52 gene=Clim_evmTU2s52